MGRNTGEPAPSIGSVHWDQQPLRNDGYDRDGNDPFKPRDGADLQVDAGQAKQYLHLDTDSQAVSGANSHVYGQANYGQSQYGDQMNN